MTMISKSNKLVTLINVFTGAPAHQQEIVDLLARATETSVRMRRVSFLPACTAASTARGS